jgi:cAMP-dependent protein kinase regulator
MYETFLSTVPLLSGLNTWEKAKIADALETETFDRGEVVIHQGDVGEYFYLVESGEAEVIIEGRGVVKQYTRGDYFGGTLSVPLLGLKFIWRGWGL